MEKSIFPKEMMSNNSLTIESIAGRLFHLEMQLHLIHWQTNGYAEHQATGALYSFIHDFKDNLVEKIMGYTGRKPAVFKIDPLINTSALNVVVELMSFASELKKYGETNSYHDVCNLADALSGEGSKTKFLLTLS